MFLKGSEGKAVSQSFVFGNEGAGHDRGYLCFGGAGAEGMEAKSTCGQSPNNF